MGLASRKYIELRVRLHTAGEVWYLRLPCLPTEDCDSQCDCDGMCYYAPPPKWGH